MFKKIKTKYLNKLVKQHQENLSFLSEKSVKLILQRDYGIKAKQNKSDINTYYNYFIKNYIKILEYLKNDYKQKYVYDNYDKKEGKSFIKDELKAIKDNYKDLSKYNLRITRNNGLRIFPLQYVIEKWKVLNDTFIEYPKLLYNFECIIDNIEYKEINIKQEYNKLLESKHLIENFDIITKSIKNDRRTDQPLYTKQ